MDSTQKKIFLILLAASAVLFALYWLPNQAASENLDMVLIFEADEVIPISYVFHMLEPAETVKQALINFAFYDYYFYGFPHFAYSALLVLPLQLLGQAGNIPLLMAVLRNFVSLLPMLAAILLLVYMQTGFRDYRAFVLFGFLNLIPGVMRNNFWWHPDSLAILFAVLTLFFLQRDRLRFDRDFYLAAAACGISAQIKSIGFYFFLAIAVYLLLGRLWEQQPWRKLTLAGLGYLLVMALAFVASNPILVYSSVRAQYLQTLARQSQFLSSGFGVLYDKGLAAVTPMLNQYFGGWLLLAAALLAAAWAAWKGPRRLLQILILAWALPLTVFVFGFSIVKYHYWLPVAVTLFSSLAVALPENRDQMAVWWRERRPWAWAAAAVLVVGAGYTLNFLAGGVADYRAQLTRAEDNPALAFYDQARAALAPLPANENYIYADNNLYVPEAEGWVRDGRFDPLDSAYIQRQYFGVVLLSQTRIRDYLNEDIEGVDPEQFEQSRAFYRAADAGLLAGYTLVYRDDFGLVFVRQDLYEHYFSD